jgi:predicted permease
LVRSLEDRLAELPGVEAVGLSASLPLSGGTWTQPFGLPGQPVQDWTGNEANFRMVTSGYLRAIGTRLLQGRGFTRDEDLYEDRRVVIVDRATAERIAPDGLAVGRRIGFPLDGDPVTAEVVGVVENVRFEDLRGQRRGTLYVPYRQEASREVTVVVRTSAAATAVAGRIRSAVAEVAPQFPIHGLRPLEAHVARATAPIRYTLTLMIGFAGMALILATIGLWGVIAFSVGRRTREIGVRMALGAPGGRLVREITLWGLRLAGIGMVAGFVAALILTPALSGLLFGVGPFDPPIYGGVALLVTAVALAACYLPARRASRVDPMVALRAD